MEGDEGDGKGWPGMTVMESGAEGQEVVDGDRGGHRRWRGTEEDAGG